MTHARTIQKKFGKIIALGIFFSFILGINAFPQVGASASEPSPIGFWKTIDDKTSEVRSIVKIWKAEDGTLTGRIEKIFPKPGEEPNPKCTKCKGDKKNQPILGMKFMWGFQGSGSTWKGGRILDPENGKTYNCQLTVADDGNKLKVYGYIKVLFKIGRTQSWLRYHGD